MLHASCILYCFIDENKFGQKLLEKFGWSKGKGLGANEDGKVDHVKVALKTDTRGGYGGRNYIYCLVPSF